MAADARGVSLSRPDEAVRSPKVDRSFNLLDAAFVTACPLLVVAASALLLSQPDGTLTTTFFRSDAAWLIAGTLVLAVGLLGRLPAIFGRWPELARHPRAAAVGLALLAAGVSLIGSVTAYRGFALSYDEVMAEFDARIILGGHLIAAVPPEWRPYAPALAPHFLVPVPGHAAWVSLYLPVNAMLRAAFSIVGTPLLTGPVLLGIAVLALVGIGRRLWPDRPDATLVSTFLLVTAPQVLVTAMTPYAMTGHLALNLGWLWLFLRGDRIGHGGAALVGFAACGLHQVVFHPLFAAPFLVGVVLKRRWLLAAFYLAAYAAAGTVWTLYWQVLTASAVAADPAAVRGAGLMMERVTGFLRAFDWGGLDLMAKNLVRFIAWENPILLPLVALAGPAIRSGRGIARPLATGIALTILLMFVLLPDQGHGWGYRYLHGLIGSACLLAGQGWVVVTARMEPTERVHAQTAIGLICAATLLLLVPSHAIEVGRFLRPYADAVSEIQAKDADIVIVDASRLAYGSDLARNDPYLRNRPKVLVLDRIEPAALPELCRRGSVATFGTADGIRLGVPTVGTDPSGLAPGPGICSPP